MGYMERINKARAQAVLIETTKGLIDVNRLTKQVTDEAIEYYLDGELVHRSATVQLKGVEGAGDAQNF